MRETKTVRVVHDEGGKRVEYDAAKVEDRQKLRKLGYTVSDDGTQIETP